ncbi:hypothetical protein AMTRI_Chr06g200720 [Amborella trichopoda]
MKVLCIALILVVCLFDVRVNSQTDSCSSNLDLGASVSFNTSSLICLSVWSSHNYILRYGQTSQNTWSFVLSAPNNNTWVGIGFSPSGSMVGSSAVVGWLPTNGNGVIKQYYLGGKSTPQVNPDQGDLPLDNSSLVLVSQSSRLYLAFQLQTGMPRTRLLYALGSPNDIPSSNARISQHQDMISTSIEYSTGTSSTTSTPYTTLRRTHGLLNLVGWGILLPIGAIAARFLRQWDPLWFYLHLGFQTTGFALGLAGVISGFRLYDKLAADVPKHRAIGISILVIGCLQVMAILARPDKASKVRKYWNWYHHWMGRGLVILAAANIFYGIHLGEDKPKAWNVGYGASLGVLATIAFVLQLRMWMAK